MEALRFGSITIAFGLMTSTLGILVGIVPLGLAATRAAEGLLSASLEEEQRGQAALSYYTWSDEVRDIADKDATVLYFGIRFFWHGALVFGFWLIVIAWHGLRAASRASLVAVLLGCVFAFAMNLTRAIVLSHGFMPIGLATDMQLYYPMYLTYPTTIVLMWVLASPREQRREVVVPVIVIVMTLMSLYCMFEHVAQYTFKESPLTRIFYGTILPYVSEVLAVHVLSKCLLAMNTRNDRLKTLVLVLPCSVLRAWYHIAELRSPSWTVALVMELLSVMLECRTNLVYLQGETVVDRACRNTRWFWSAAASCICRPCQCAIWSRTNSTPMGPERDEGRKPSKEVWLNCEGQTSEAATDVPDDTSTKAAPASRAEAPRAKQEDAMVANGEASIGSSIFRTISGGKAAFRTASSSSIFHCTSGDTKRARLLLFSRTVGYMNFIEICSHTMIAAYFILTKISAGGPGSMPHCPKQVAQIWAIRICAELVADIVTASVSHTVSRKNPFGMGDTTLAWKQVDIYVVLVVCYLAIAGTLDSVSSMTCWLCAMPTEDGSGLRVMGPCGA